MEEKLSDSEGQYWDCEIPDTVIEELTNRGEIWLAPHVKVPYRVDLTLWNYRIKKRYRQTK